MNFADTAKFLDWGIPVLYSTNPGQVLLPSKGRKPKWAKDYGEAAQSGTLIETLAAGKSGGGAPSVVAKSTRVDGGKAKKRVALIDIDAKAGFLPELAEAANREQNYYHFEVVYLPVPSGYARPDQFKNVQTHLPWLDPVLSGTPKSLSVDSVCCLTTNMVSTVEQGRHLFNLFAATLPGNRKVIAVSTFGLREYARQANVPFAKAILAICLSMIVQADPRWEIERHEETVGCPFDLCRNRDDIVIGLRKMRFDHDVCRRKIRDPDQLGAIDALAQLQVDSEKM